MIKPSLIVLGNGTQGLGIIRSAGNSGMDIIQINDKLFSAARFSRYITKYIKANPNLLIDITNDLVAVDKLLNILLTLDTAQPSIILGTNEDINEFIFNNREILKSKYFIPENEYELIFDKYMFNNILPKENQIDTFLASYHVFSELNNSKSNYILKGRKGNNFKNKIGKKAILLNELNEGSLTKIIEQIGEVNLIIQKVVESNFPVQSVCSLSVDGEIKSLFIYEKLRQHPDKFGTGTYLRSVDNNEVLKIAEVLLKKINYTGISEIEFIFDPLDNKFKVIEMNPRTWKSINFATQCKQNIVQKYIDYVKGLEVVGGNYYVTNKYWTDIFADVSQMIRERKIFSYHFKSMYECTWEKDDPLPFIASIVLIPFIALKI